MLAYRRQWDRRRCEQAQEPPLHQAIQRKLKGPQMRVQSWRPLLQECTKPHCINLERWAVSVKVPRHKRINDAAFAKEQVNNRGAPNDSFRTNLLTIQKALSSST